MKLNAIINYGKHFEKDMRSLGHELSMSGMSFSIGKAGLAMPGLCEGNLSVKSKCVRCSRTLERIPGIADTKAKCTGKRKAHAQAG